MKRFLFTFCLVFSTLTIFSQAPSWLWADAAYNGNSDFANDVAVDPTNGDIVVVGEFTGDMSAFYGSNFVSALGGGFVARYNSSGTLLWAFKIGENDNDRCKGVAIDASGNIFVCGYLTLNCDFHGNSVGPNNFVSSGGQDAYLAKFNSAGMYQWAKIGGGANDDEALAVSIGGSNIYVTGYYHNAATFGALSTHSAQNHDDIFLLSYDTNGNEQWLADAGTTANGYGYDVVADNNNVFITGSSQGNLSVYDALGNLVASPATSGNWDGFTFSFSNTGNFNWASSIAGPGANQSYSIAEKGSNLYITGSTQNNTAFTGYLANPVIPSGGGLDFYVAQLNSSNGIAQWVNCEPGNNDQEGTQIDVDVNSNVVVTGYFKSDITFGSGPTFTSAGNEDIFVASYSSAGAFRWATYAGGIDTDIPHGIAVDNSTGTFVVGEYKQAATFGSTTLPNQNSRNIFVAQLGCSPVTNNTIS